MKRSNVTHEIADPSEVNRFAAIAERWWDPSGETSELHHINPARLSYIHDWCCAHFSRDPNIRNPFTGLTVLDVGCGGGLLCEPLTRLGASVIGIDPTPETIHVARAHAAQMELEIDYRIATPNELVSSNNHYNIVLNLEVIEHVSDPFSHTQACAQLLAPGGIMVLSTLNRNFRSFITAIVAAEYILGWLPVGTHRWHRFVKPSELAQHVRDAGLRLANVSGLTLTDGEWEVTTDIGVNYLAIAIKD
tara:strand:+ start:4637 stop:5380 length:744 start_codon:yes stop_codon:yes gene_type:complete